MHLPKNKPWTEADVRQIKMLLAENIAISEIARILGRTETALEHRCKMENIRLPRTNFPRSRQLQPRADKQTFERRPPLSAEARATLKAERELAGEKALADIREREQSLRFNMERLKAERLARQKQNDEK